MAVPPLNKPAIITGCHRSGTTLFGLMLDSHPMATLVDEDDFDNGKLVDYMESADYAPVVVFKLPAEASNFRAFKTLPGLKVLWCVRDPRDVVLSYHNLHSVRPGEFEAVPASVHDWGGMAQIADYLGRIDPPCIHPGVAEYRRISAIPRRLRTRWDAILMGALYWELKNRLPALYVTEGLAVHVVVYEELIARPRAVMERVLGFLGLPWHDDVLRHHELHQGVYAGGTLGHRPVDPSNTGKWQHGLSREEVDIVEAYCAGGMARYGYAAAERMPDQQEARRRLTLVSAGRFRYG